MLKRSGFFVFVFIWLMGLAACSPAAPVSESVPEAETGQEPATAEEATAEKIVIGMMTMVSHPSLDAIQQGAKDQIAAGGYIDGENIEIIVGNAEGDMATLNTIAQQFIDENVDLIVAITTPALQAAYNATQDAGGPPIVFSGVSNPYIAGVAAAPDDHPAWIIGNQLLDPVADTMGLIQEIVPEAKVIGIVYNPGEANAAFLVELAQTEAEAMGITLELATVSNSNEVQTAAESLLARDITAFLVVSDNTVSSAFEAMVQVANDNDLPLFGTSASFPPRGAVASYGVDPYQEGVDSGQLVVDYLNGDMDIATATIGIQDAVLLTVNPQAATEQGVEIPTAVMERADSVIEE